MRRVPAFLMIATLLVALVPSTALAVRPVPVITSIGSSGYDMGISGLCTLYVTATWEGRGVASVTFTALKNDSPVSSPGLAVPRKAYSMDKMFEQVSLAADVWKWSVQLRDRKGEPLGLPQTTSGDTWTDSASCPNGPTGAAYVRPQ